MQGLSKSLLGFLPTKHNCTINYYSGNTHVSWVVWSQLGCCCSVISPGAHSSVLIKSSWQRSCVVINSSLPPVSPQHFVAGVVFFCKLHSEPVFCLCGYYLCYYCLYLLDCFSSLPLNASPCVSWLTLELQVQEQIMHLTMNSLTLTLCTITIYSVYIFCRSIQLCLFDPFASFGQKTLATESLIDF